MIKKERNVDCCHIFRSIIFAPVENKSITTFFSTLENKNKKNNADDFVEDDDDDRCGVLRTLACSAKYIS